MSAYKFRGDARAFAELAVEAVAALDRAEAVAELLPGRRRGRGGGGGATVRGRGELDLGAVDEVRARRERTPPTAPEAAPASRARSTCT